MSDLRLLDNFFALPQRALWHAPSNTAIISDLHLGAEAELSRRGIFMPDVSGAALMRAWQELGGRLAGAGRSRLVIAGDFFDTPTPDAAAIGQAAGLLAALPGDCEVMLLPGNHDPAPAVLRSILHARVDIAASAAVGGYRVMHGDRCAGEDEGKTGAGLIVGHQHPAVVLATRVQSAKMPCFAVCRCADPGRDVMVLPAFSRAPLGSNLSRRHWLLDLPWPGEERIRIYGVIDSAGGSQVLDFGKLSDLRLPF